LLATLIITIEQSSPYPSKYEVPPTRGGKSADYFLGK